MVNKPYVWNEKILAKLLGALEREPSKSFYSYDKHFDKSIKHFDKSIILTMISTFDKVISDSN